jgi:fucose permease
MAGATAATVAVPSTLRRASFDPGGGYSLASLLMFVTLASVVFGVSSLAPGIGVPLGMVALLVWLRTAAVARHRQARGELLDHAERAQLFVRSFGVALALIALTCVAGCAAFFAACFACIATFAALEPIGDDTAMAAGYIVHGIVGLAIVVPTLWFVAKMVRRRWRRDIGEGYGMESPPHNDST